MSNSTYLFVANEAPKPPSSGAVTQTAAGSIGAGTYSFLVVAWYRSRRTDSSYAGWWKHSNYLPDNTSPVGGEFYKDWSNVTVTGASDDRVTLKWQKVDGPVVEYGIYYQAASALNLNNEAIKVSHSETDNGDGTISGDIDALTADTSNMEEYLVDTAADPTNTFTLAGDVRSCFYSGCVNPTLDSSGAVQVDSVALNASGNNTVVTCNAGTPLNGNDTWVRYIDGKKRFYNQPPYLNASSLLAIGPVSDQMERIRPIKVAAFNGVYVNKSYAKDKLRDYVSLILPPGAIDYDEYNQLLRCMRAGHRMLLYNLNATYTSNERGWYGYLVDTDYLHTEGKRAREDFELGFIVEKGWSIHDDELENIIT